VSEPFRFVRVVNFVLLNLLPLIPRRRHGDFDLQCKDDNPCFTTAQFAFALAKMKREYEKQGDASIRPPFPAEVLVISDETEPAFYEEVRARRWRSTFDVNGIESSKLVKELGGW